MKISQKFNRQTGYTMVEFLIAATIGLILLAGVGQLFIGSGQTFRAQRQLANIQDGGRFALWFLKEDIEGAGWTATPPNSTITNAVLILNSDTFSGAGQCPGDICSADGANDFDDITIGQYGPFDCNGSAAPIDPNVDLDAVIPPIPAGANQVVRNRYFVQNNQLFCWGNASPVAQPLVENVDAFQVLYGVSSINPPANADGKLCWDRGVDQYVSTPVVDSSVGVVVAIRFSLLIAGDPNRETSINIPRTYIVGDRTYQFNDQIPRRVFNLTVPIRNAPTLITDGRTDLHADSHNCG